MRGWTPPLFGSATVLFVFAVIESACGAIAPPGGCVAGQSIQCAGSGGCSGYQVCRDDGSGYDPCTCGGDAGTDADATVPGPADMDAASAYYLPACQAPEGPARTLDSTQVPYALNGKWWCCWGAAELMPAVEFTLDGNWYQLTLVDGAWVRNLGPTTSGTYAVVPSQPSIHFAIDLSYTGGGTLSYPLNGTILDDPDPKMSLGGGSYVAIQ